MIRHTVDRPTFIKKFVLQYPEFIRFLKDKKVYKRFFRALFLNNGFSHRFEILDSIDDRTLLRRIIDVAFNWDMNRNDDMTPKKWSEIDRCWRKYVCEHITEDGIHRKKIRNALLKTHMAMYKHKPLKQLKVCFCDLIVIYLR